MTLVELCCGTASVSLYAMARIGPLCGFMGSKRRWASMLCEALGVAATAPDRVVLVDAGPWGDVWTQLRGATVRRAVAGLLLAWDGQPVEKLWQDCVSAPPSSDPAQRVAQYLWLQARSAGTIPVWWNAGRSRWESPTGSRTEEAHARGGSAALTRRQKGRAKKPGPACETGSGRRGIQRPATLARRVADLDGLPWGRLEVVHGRVEDVEPIPGASVLFDPPYAGCPRYAELLPRAAVLEVAARWAQTSRVVVCEAEALPLDGWTARRLPGRKPEWITANWPIQLEEQLGLWEAA